MMGAIGTGNVAPGVCTLSLGTSGTVYSHFDRPFVDPEGEIAAFCDSTGGWLPLLCTMNVTNTTEIAKSLFGLDNARLERLARRAGPGAGGLLFLPFVDGERVPVLPFSSAVLLRPRPRGRSMPPTSSGRSWKARSSTWATGSRRMRELGLKPAEIRATGRRGRRAGSGSRSRPTSSGRRS